MTDKKGYFYYKPVAFTTDALDQTLGEYDPNVYNIKTGEPVKEGELPQPEQLLYLTLTMKDGSRVRVDFEDKETMDAYVRQAEKENVPIGREYVYK